MSIPSLSISVPRSHPLFGPLLKVERAKYHLSETESCIASFLAQQPFEVACEHNFELKQQTFIIVRADPPPDVLSALIGDVIHNLRSAFDLIACEVVELGGGDRSKCYFPFTRNTDEFNSARSKKLQGAPEIAVDIIRSLQPYQNEDNETLWALHKLDILDKHRMIMPVGTAFSYITMDFSVGFRDFFTADGESIEPILLSLRPKKPVFPLKPDLTLHTTNYINGKIDLSPTFTFEVAFGEGQIIDGEPVAPTLKRFVNFAAQAIVIFQNELFSN